MARSVVAEARIPVGRHADGSWLHAPIGALVQVDAGARVVCHACGTPLQRISGVHLSHHGLTQASYRERYGLNRTTSLMAPRLLEEWEAEGRRRHASIPALRDGLRIGQGMAGDGRLLAASHAAQGRGTLRAQGRATRSAIVAPVAAANAETASQAREARARDAGFPSAAALAIRRQAEGRTCAQIAAELRTSHGWAKQAMTQAVHD